MWESITLERKIIVLFVFNPIKHTHKNRVLWEISKVYIIIAKLKKKKIKKAERLVPAKLKAFYP